MKQLIFFSQNGRGGRRDRRRDSLIPVAAGLTVAAILLCLGLTQFLLRGYLAQDGFAVPRDTLSGFLRAGDGGERVELLPVSAGEAIYTSAVGGSQSYFIGESKLAVSRGYPIFTREGQVLYFLDDSLRMVTDDWEALSSYEGLYLSDGVTFNADRAQADLERVLLVQVDGGYQLAQRAAISNAWRESGIEMNSICAFSETAVVYYTYRDGALEGGAIQIPEGSTITIGGETYDYLDFLKRLGLWEEQPVKEPGPAGPSDEPEPPEDGDEGNETQGGTTALLPAEPADPAAPASRPDPSPRPSGVRPPSEVSEPKPPADVPAAPADPPPSGGSAPEAPAAPQKPIDKNPDYKEPVVSFGPLSGWVYTISTDAVVEDPAGVLKNGGVQLYVFEVDEDGKESRVLRQTATASGELVLGQVRPNSRFHVVAEYSYNDANNIPRSKTLDLGYVDTLPFQELGPIAISLRTEEDPYDGEENRVEIFPFNLQARDVVFTNVSNGVAVEPDGKASFLSGDLKRAERYVNSLTLSVTPKKGGKAQTLAMNVRALKLLCDGYTLSYWNTPEQLKPDTEYTYTVSMADRFGNRFTVVTNKDPDPYWGRTSRETPTVSIRVPDKTNVTNSTQIDITWKNVNQAVVTANDKAGMGDVAAGLYLYKTNDDKKAPIQLTAYPVDEKGDRIGTGDTTGCYLPLAPLEKKENGEDVGTPVKGATFHWVIKDLEPFTGYTAAVKCGRYDLGDERLHIGETLHSITQFTTVALQGRASYTAEVDQIGEDRARLKFRMNSMDESLQPVIERVTFTLQEQKSGIRMGSVTLRRDDLKNLLIDWTKPFDEEENKIVFSNAPVYLEGDGDSASNMELTLLFPKDLDPEFKARTTNAWDFLLNTSSLTPGQGGESCWMSLQLAGNVTSGGATGRLFGLQPVTAYKGNFTTVAKLGGTYTDVTSASSKSVYFQTLSKEALVNFENAFPADTFIELYGLQIEDEGKCLLPDQEDRGGNITVRIFHLNDDDTIGEQAAILYLDAADYAEPAKEPLRITGLNTGKNGESQRYVMIFYAQQYSTGPNAAPEVDRALKYRFNMEGSGAQDVPADKSWYVFSTGNSVTGSLKLLNISQQYYAADGQLIDSLSMLNDGDFYLGVYQEASSLWYGPADQKEADAWDKIDQEAAELSEPDKTAKLNEKTNEVLDRHLEEIRAKETDIQSLEDETVRESLLKQLEYNRDPRRTKDDADAPYTGNKALTVSRQRNQITGNVWTSRLIRVEPGEQYVIYNIDSISDPRIIFYYVDNKQGVLRYYNRYYDGAYMKGDVFQVPAYNKDDNGDKYYFMTISGRNQQMRSGLIIQKYDPKITEGQPNLGLTAAESGGKAAISEGMQLNSGGGSISISDTGTLAFVSDYLPVTGGSVYELKGRDTNVPDASVLTRRNAPTEGSVLFYDSAYVFLGGYTVGCQTALVKAPFGAAYCRFNLQMKRNEDTGTFIAPSWDNGLSFKLYAQATQDWYVASMRAMLEDKSDTKMLEGGSYSISVYSTTAAVSDATDLSALDSGSWVAAESSGQKTAHGQKIDSIFSIPQMPVNRGFKAVLTIRPKGWSNQVVLDTIYFTSNRVVTTIDDLGDLIAVRSNPAGSYVVTADIPDLTTRVLSSDRPFTGTIDFQGHKVTTTTFESMFYRISEGGVVKNLELEYSPEGSSATSAYNYKGTVAYVNYGTIQNVVVRYKPSNPTYGLEVGYSGGICYSNSGTIDGFVVVLEKDILVSRSFGGVCYENRGLVSNGYVTGDPEEPVVDSVTDRTRMPTVVHRYKDPASNAVMSSDAAFVSLGVGYNYPQGIVRNMFTVGDVIIESNDAHANKDSDPKDNSVEYTHYTGLIIGYSGGSVEDVYSSGDRLDYCLSDRKYAVMKERGPAVGYVAGMYYAENVNYFSEETYDISGNRDNIGSYNVHDENESLYDYKWQEGKLGADGTRFNIRAMLEKDDGYYPQLILPACFTTEDVKQPLIRLDSRTRGKIEILFNEVRLQGRDQALVTIGFANPAKSDVKGFSITDGSTALPLKCEVLAQAQVGDTYRVDVLIELNEGNIPQGSYTIQSVSFARENVVPTADNGERIIYADFWKEIGSKQDWIDQISGGPSDIRGNFLLTADLDFSDSTSYDWHCSRNFRGKLNGGIYKSETVELTDCLGALILDNDGVPRTIETFGELVGMHIISNVGSAKNGAYESGRSNGRYSNSLFWYLYGTMENLVFEDFHSVDTGSNGDANTEYAGVVAIAYPGAIVDNCHVRDSNFYGRARIGGLVGYVSGATVTNSSSARVSIVLIRRNEGTDAVSVGGLIGHSESGLISNSFAASVRITADDIYSANGLGGMIGYANSTAIESCYASGVVDLTSDTSVTGTVDAGSGRVGGLAGQITGESALTGCWSTTTVMTAADFAGGLVGYHANGELVNNYTSSTLITRALEATSVHRICNNINYDEVKRRDNYAFEGQYLTYALTPEEAKEQNLSRYQFGIWDQPDGATALLTAEELRKVATWTGRVGLDSDAFDLMGDAGLVISMGAQSSGVPFSGVNGSRSNVVNGVMPKLRHSETGQVLYDQRDTSIGFSNTSLLSRIQITQSPEQMANEEFQVKLALFSLREDVQEVLNRSQGENHFTEQTMDQLADWDKMTVIGGQVSRANDHPHGVEMLFRRDDYGAYGHGQEFSFTVQYGDKGGGHYLDSYVLTLPVYTENPVDGETGEIRKDTDAEVLQVRLGLDTDQPFYKRINNVQEWNEFFAPGKGHDTFFENVLLVNTDPFVFKKGDTLNVKVNRLRGDTNADLLTREPVTVSTEGTLLLNDKAGKSLISQVATKVELIDFKDVSLSSTEYKDPLPHPASQYHNDNVQKWTGGDNKGVIGLLQGSIVDCTFSNVSVDGGSSGCVGMVGRMYGKAENVKLRNISVVSRGDYVGGLAGYADVYSEFVNVTLDVERDEDGKIIDQPDGVPQRNTIRSWYSSQVGGLVGRLEGIGSDLTVSQTEVYGRSYVGGVVGYAYSNGNRPDSWKLSGVTVGSDSKEEAEKTREPGVLVDSSGQPAPSVVVKLELTQASGSETRYVGGAVGHGNSQQYRDVSVYNTRVEDAAYEAGLTTAADFNKATYSSYAAGVMGASAEHLQDALAKNCTVITHHSYAGGISGGSVSYYNRAQDCVIQGTEEYKSADSPGSQRIGGVVGINSAYRCVSQHNVVVGDQYVGGLIGYGGEARESGTTDCIVLGREDVGGLAGFYSGGSVYSAYVTASVDKDGNRTVPTELKEHMLPEWARSYQGQTFSGTHVQGKKSVGGLMGSFWGVNFYYNSVSHGVTVQGGEYVGGFAGTYYGWHVTNWKNQNRNMSRSAMGAEVIGENYVGGAIGYYLLDTSAGTQPDSTIYSRYSPYAANFYSLLITGSVGGVNGGTASHADILLGGGSDLDKTKEVVLSDSSALGEYSSTNGKFFGYCRVYDQSTVNGKTMEEIYTGDDALLSYDTVMSKALTTGDERKAEAAKQIQLLTVTATDLTDPSLYFPGKSSTDFGGMGWSRSYWSDEALQSMYQQTSAPASFTAYETGLMARDDMVLWLDARNNTGKGYTDEDALVWQDLTHPDGSGNNATLYWNNKAGNGDVSITIDERTTVMRWNEGSLEFLSGSTAYYALLERSLSDYMNDTDNNKQDGFTVELVYTYNNPYHSNHNSVLSWTNGTYYGGFHGYYSPYGAYNNVLLHFAPNKYMAPDLKYYAKNHTTETDTEQAGKDAVRAYNTQFARSGAYVFDGTGKLYYYKDGKPAASTGVKTSDMMGNFPTENDVTWRVGQGAYTNSQLRVCGIRVYNRALTETELANNSAYDRWYYFGEEMPTARNVTNADGSVQQTNQANAQTGVLTLGMTGGASGGDGSYKLFRNDVKNYNGTLVRTVGEKGLKETYDGEALTSRGYYYVKDGSGNYSNIVEVEDPCYGPVLRTQNFGNEYYGTPRYEFPAGQEGEDGTLQGTLHSTVDDMFQGGFRLGTGSGYSVRGIPGAPTTTALALLSLRPGMLPEPTAYPAGIDTVDLELDADAPEGLTYAIYSKLEPGEGDTPVLEGTWPSDSRTLTMTWDYRTPFTLRLTLGEETGDRSWTYNALGRSVMLYGKGYWYLYGSQCYTGTYQSEEQDLVTEDPAVVFLHMMDGRLLDEAGDIWDAQTGKVSGTARTPFQLLPAKPVWSGTVDGLPVKSFGTYLVSETADGPLTKEASMVSRGGELYILQGAKPYNCLVDKQDPDHPYQTYLQDDGTLKDYFTALKYPEGFRQNGIRELADNLNYTAYKPIALVRYGDGTLTAFDYTTGETIPVMSSAPSVTLMDYVAEKLHNFSLMGLISGVTSGEGLRGLAYESEVADNASLRTALASLSGNEENTMPVDGEGSGVYGDGVPGGLDGAVASEGVNGDNGLGDVVNEGQTVVEGVGTAVEGAAVNGSGTAQDGEAVEGSGIGQDGEPVPDGLTQTDQEGSPEAGDPAASDGAAEPDAGGPAASDGAAEPDAGDPAASDGAAEPDVGDPAASDGAAEPDAGDPAASDGAAEPDTGDPAASDGTAEPGAGAPASPAEPEPTRQETAISVANRYVTVYDESRGGSAVYDLKEYLSTPDEELVSQEERAEELQELGFHTSLTRKEQLPQEQVSGLLLMYVVSGGTVALLVYMSLLKKRKLDRRDDD